MPNALQFLAGPKALKRLREQGMQASDVATIPAAAGGPKGLIFQALDQWLFGEWLPSAPRPRNLLGASIGAWRMAAACHADPAAAFARLGEFYTAQRYPSKPPADLVSAMCIQLLDDVIGGHESEIIDHPHNRLHLFAIRGRGLLHQPKTRGKEMTGFAAATLTNLGSRNFLARYMERVIIADPRAQLDWLEQGFDAFETHHVTLNRDNLRTALMASGTLPLIMLAIQSLPGAPEGTYWDGGLIDYHLALPYAQSTAESNDIVLYPHFVPHIVPGWLDKTLPWRRGQQELARGWFDNVLLVAPSKEFLAQLPGGKLPDRNDFKAYEGRDDQRMRDWKFAIGEGQRLRDELAQFIERPDLSRLQALS